MLKLKHQANLLLFCQFFVINSHFCTLESPSHCSLGLNVNVYTVFAMCKLQFADRGDSSVKVDQSSEFCFLLKIVFHCFGKLIIVICYLNVYIWLDTVI